MATKEINEELIDAIMSIQHKQRHQLSERDENIYNSVYREVTGHTPGRGCSGICDTVWLSVRNYVKRLSMLPPPAPKATPKPKAKTRKPRKNGKA